MGCGAAAGGEGLVDGREEVFGQVGDEGRDAGEIEGGVARGEAAEEVSGWGEEGDFVSVYCTGSLRIGIEEVGGGVRLRLTRRCQIGRRRTCWRAGLREGVPPVLCCLKSRRACVARSSYTTAEVWAGSGIKLCGHKYKLAWGAPVLLQLIIHPRGRWQHFERFCKIRSCQQC